MSPSSGDNREHSGGDSCPCEETDCPRHGDCAECQAFHGKLGEPTACERIEAEGAEAKPAAVIGAVGDDFRLTDYASCAG